MRGRRGCLKWGMGVVIGLLLLLGGLEIFSGVENRELDQFARTEVGGSFIELDQGVVHYYLEGPDDAPLVVLIHGFSVPSYVWEPTAAYLNKNGYRTLRYDLYGRGYSDRPDLVYDITLFESQLAGLIDRMQLNEPVTVVGLSMGGPVAARYVHQHSDQVNGVIFISPVVTQVTSGVIFPLNLPGIGEYVMSAVMEPIILPKLQLDDFAHPENFPDWEAKYRVQMQFKGTGRALLSTIRELVKLNPEVEYQALQRTDLPVMLIWGEGDQSIGFDQIEVLQQILPDSMIRIVEDAGHLVHYERSDEVNPELIDYLDRISR
ncbi:MAG: alpha/beta hydrolase [Anaerolineales bacterium]|nr:alpha/beta hydrolase [Anaerolineales bacterium]